ncbi:MAG: hypothetical protein KGN36_20995, partial [Acidobacteriota bacterium]|nr:hypothetical protein [Acidobacteriota bacterium]
ADSAAMFGAHISDEVAAPCSKTKGGASAAPLIRTNAGPNEVGTIRDSLATGHSRAARESR